MKLLFSALADYANVTRDGKLNVMGIFDHVFARGLPSRFPHMQLVLRLEIRPEEVGDPHALRIEMRDPDDESVFDIDGQFTPPDPRPARPVAVNQVIGLNDLPLRKTGLHRVVIRLDRELLQEIPLHVLEPPQRPPPPPGDGTFH